MAAVSYEKLATGKHPKRKAKTNLRSLRRARTMSWRPRSYRVTRRRSRKKELKRKRQSIEKADEALLAMDEKLAQLENLKIEKRELLAASTAGKLVHVKKDRSEERRVGKECRL